MNHKVLASVLAITLLVASAGCRTRVTADIRCNAKHAIVQDADEQAGVYAEPGKKPGRKHISGDPYTPGNFEATRLVWKVKKGKSFWVRVAPPAGYAESAQAERIVVPRKSRDPINVDLRFELAEIGGATDVTDGLPDWGRDDQGRPPEADSAWLWVESTPPGATVLVAESMDGKFRPWTNTVGEPRTPVRGAVPVGTTLWVKVKHGKTESEAEYVHVQSVLPTTVSFDLTNGKASPAAKERVTIQSTPPGATVLVSETQYGVYRPWPPGAKSQLTPMEVQLDVGSTLWLKVRKDQYETSEPQLIRVEKGKPIAINVALKRFLSCLPPEGRIEVPGPAPVLAAPDEPAGIESVGYAPIGENLAAARNAAVLDALGTAIEKRFGDRVSAGGITSNYALMQNRLQSVAGDRNASYEVIEETKEGNLFRVALRVRFTADLVEELARENITILVGGIEATGPQLPALPGLSMRNLLADALRGSSVGVTVKQEPIRQAGDLAQYAADSTSIKHQSDVALHVDTLTEVHDKFGDFYSCKVTVNYQLLQPIPASPFVPTDFNYVIATGFVEGYNKKRQLSAQSAASHAMRDVSRQVADEVLTKLAGVYDGAVSHEVYVQGFLSQRERQTLMTELGRLPGVRHVRFIPFSRALAPEGDPNRDLHQFLLYLTPSARATVPNAIERLKEVDVEVVEHDLYNTVAMIRQPPVPK